MFSGIVETVGEVAAIVRGPRGARLRVRARLDGPPPAVGESISVAGCCLTVARRGRGWFEADCSPQTLRLTTLGELRRGAGVNLERALPASGRLGGHLVQGHVDGTGEAVAVRREGNSVVAVIEAPPAVRRYLVPRGSVAVDGVSLTVSKLGADRFEVTLIPQTLRVTTLGRLRRGGRVNLEADVLGKYVRAFLDPAGEEPPG
jgi:riboflavin synthase